MNQILQTSSPSQSSLRDASSPKVGALGSPHKLHLFAKASPFGRGVTAGDGEGEDADRVQRCSERQPQGFAQQLHFTGGTPMDSEKVIKRDGEYVLHTYNRNPIVLEKGHGLRAIGPEGQQYLDFTSGIGVNSLGYCDLDWAEAVSEQAHKLQHSSNLYYTAPCGKLAKKLCKRTGMSKVFFGNSGAEANEGAIKAARKYSVDHYSKDRTTVITLVNSFHGRTIATLTATGQEVFHNYFGPFNEGFLYAPAGDMEALQELVDRNTCAVMLELIQGEGGVMALDPDYVQAVRKLCDEKDLVLIVDEVQTGVGRTGTFLCCEHYNLKPDVVTLAKGLGGGLPIGAVLMNEKVAAGMGPGTHGSTFGGNPVVCAGANVVVDRMDQSFLANVNERAVQLRAGIAKLPHVKSISGIGLMVGIEFYDLKAADVLAACREAGLLVLTAKTRLRLLPPLTLSEHDVDMALEILGDVLSKMEPTAPKEQA